MRRLFLSQGRQRKEACGLVHSDSVSPTKTVVTNEEDEEDEDERRIKTGDVDLLAAFVAAAFAVFQVP